MLSCMKALRRDGDLASVFEIHTLNCIIKPKAFDKHDGQDLQTVYSSASNHQVSSLPVLSNLRGDLAVCLFYY